MAEDEEPGIPTISPHLHQSPANVKALAVVFRSLAVQTKPEHRCPDTFSSKDLPDHYGTELRDREAAHKEAVFAAGEMLKETGREFLRDDVWEMHVTDEAGATVCRLRFSAEDCD